jgi:hypothetical protein
MRILLLALAAGISPAAADELSTLRKGAAPLPVFKSEIDALLAQAAGR